MPSSATELQPRVMSEDGRRWESILKVQHEWSKLGGASWIKLYLWKWNEVLGNSVMGQSAVDIGCLLLDCLLGKQTDDAYTTNLYAMLTHLHAGEPLQALGWFTDF
jgi:hypothetical protein